MMKRIIPGTLFFLCISWINPLAAHPGIGIVMDSQGNVFYTDLVHVWKITPNNQHSIAVKDVHTHELYIDSEDNLYGEHIWYEGEATDKWGHYIWCLKKNGQLVKIKDRTEGFPVDNTLQRDYQGNTYWPEKEGDHEVLKMTSPSGTVQMVTDHRFQDIRWLHIRPCTKEVFVVDHLAVKRVNEKGQVSVVAENLKEKPPVFSQVRDQHYLMGVWTDKTENVYAAVFGARKIKQFTPAAEVKTIYTSEKGWSPSGGLIAPDGTLWVMEFSSSNKTRVVRLTPDGERSYYQS